MTRLEWKCDQYIVYNGRKIPLGEEVPLNPIRQYSPLIRKVLPYIKLLDNLHSYFFISGFIKRTIGTWIRQNLPLQQNPTFIDIGCGDLHLRSELPENLIYNAFDISLSEYALKLAMSLKSVNLAVASATKIPLESNQASMITATEVFEHIPAIDKALDEIHRIASPHALLLVSIPNNNCYKYYVKGQHEDHYNRWTFDEFVSLMQMHEYKFVKGIMKGWWIPFPSSLVGKRSYQLPITSDYEYYNTNFLFIFQILK